MADDPRIAALEGLFVVADLGTGRYRLTLPEIASGGWGSPDDGPTGTRERVSLVRAALVGAILRAVDAATTPADAPACTGVTAKWCPVHGDCACPEDEARPGERAFDGERCPLHAPTSDHGEEARDKDHEIATLAEKLASIQRAEEHERAALVRERDEARAALAAAEERAIGAGQLPLFDEAPPAPVALPTLPDAYKPKPRKCGVCGLDGHNSRTCTKRVAKALGGDE